MGLLASASALALQSTAFGANAADKPATAADVGPIHVDLCKAQISRRVHDLELKFRNVGTVASHVVLVSITIGTQHFEVRDVGTFSPGAEIDHHFRADVDPWSFLIFSSGVPPAICKVTSVDFVDGSHWSAPPAKSSHQTKE